MKALTVRQPHAQLIALGVKTIETRTKPTKYRGPLLIHAGAAAPKEQDIGPWHVWNESGHVWWLDGRKGDPESANYFACPLGAIVASCKLVDCVPIVRDVEHAYENATDPKKALTYAMPFVVPEFDILGERPPDAGKTLIRVMYRPAGDGRRHTNHWDQLPYGDFTPGRFAWLLEDIKPVEQRCPACWGSGGDREDPEGRLSCWICKGHGRTQPIPAKGKLGLWNWEP